MTALEYEEWTSILRSCLSASSFSHSKPGMFPSLILFMSLMCLPLSLFSVVCVSTLFFSLLSMLSAFSVMIMYWAGGQQTALTFTYFFFPMMVFFLISFFFFSFFLYFLLYWFCHTSTCILHGCTCVPHPEPPSHLPPHIIPLGHPSAPAPSIQYPASNLDWRFISHMILYMF